MHLKVMKNKSSTKTFPIDTRFSEKIPGLLEAFAWLLIDHRTKNLESKSVEPEKVMTCDN